MTALRLNRRWMVLISIVAVVAGWLYYYYSYLNHAALKIAQSLCAEKGPIEIVDHGLWRKLTSVTQDDRFRNPGVYSVEIRERTATRLASSDRVLILGGLGFNGNNLVIRQHNPVMVAKGPFSDLGLMANFTHYDCLRASPSKAREVIYGY